jgi:hypothetical protein
MNAVNFESCSIWLGTSRVVFKIRTQASKGFAFKHKEGSCCKVKECNKDVLIQNHKLRVGCRSCLLQIHLFLVEIWHWIHIIFLVASCCWKIECYHRLLAFIMNYGLFLQQMKSSDGTRVCWHLPPKKHPRLCSQNNSWAHRCIVFYNRLQLNESWILQIWNVFSFNINSP